jgi:aerobic carbon-monoxide dehydrogenase medium subunit
MIPAAFDYVRADSLSQAIELLAANPDGAKLVAGGHTLIPTLKLRLASPALLIDISRIAQLKGIEVGEQIKIGALAPSAARWRMPIPPPIGRPSSSRLMP